MPSFVLLGAPHYQWHDREIVGKDDEPLYFLMAAFKVSGDFDNMALYRGADERGELVADLRKGSMDTREHVNMAVNLKAKVEGEPDREIPVTGRVREMFKFTSNFKSELVDGTPLTWRVSLLHYGCKATLPDGSVVAGTKRTALREMAICVRADLIDQFEPLLASAFAVYRASSGSRLTPSMLTVTFPQAGPTESPTRPHTCRPSDALISSCTCIVLLCSSVHTCHSLLYTKRLLHLFHVGAFKPADDGSVEVIVLLPA